MPSPLTQPLVQIPVDAQVHRHVERGCLLARLSFGGLRFLHGDGGADRLVP